MININKDQLAILEISKVASFSYVSFREGFFVYEGFCNGNRVLLYLEPNNEVGSCFGDIILLPNVSKKDLLNNVSLKVSNIHLTMGNHNAIS